MYSITEINIKRKTCSISMVCEYLEVDHRKLWSIPSQSNWPPLPHWQRDSPQETQHHLVFVLIDDRIINPKVRLAFNCLIYVQFYVRKHLHSSFWSTFHHGNMTLLFRDSNVTSFPMLCDVKRDIAIISRKGEMATKWRQVNFKTVSWVHGVLLCIEKRKKWWQKKTRCLGCAASHGQPYVWFHPSSVFGIVIVLCW